MAAALAADRLDADLVAVEARRHPRPTPRRGATAAVARCAAARRQQAVTGVVCDPDPPPT